MKTHQFLYPILIAAIAALAIFGTGCKEDTPPNPSFKKLLPSEIRKIRDGEESVYKLTYDNENRIRNIKEYQNDETLSWDYSIDYDAFGRINNCVENSSDGVFTSTFIYTHDFAIRTIIELNQTTIYRINKLRQCLHAYHQGDPLHGKLNTSYTYDVKGNCIKIETSDLESEYIENMTYDNNCGIFFCVNAPSWFLTMDEGVITSLQFHEMNNPKVRKTATSTSTYDYIYNDEGYPSKFILTSSCPQVNDVHYEIKYIDAK